MTHKVTISKPAGKNIKDHYQWIKRKTDQGAENWRVKIQEAISSLKNNPTRNAPTRETASFDREVRCLLVGKKRSTFRILYHVKEDEVVILAIRRPAQGSLTPEDLD